MVIAVMRLSADLNRDAIKDVNKQFARCDSFEELYLSACSASLAM
jgi:hypothetical protein